MESFGGPGARAGYHSCLFTSVSLDAEWTRKPHKGGRTSPQDALDEAFEAISLRCARYKGRIDKNREEQGLPLDDPDGSKAKRWESLYRAIEYVPLGHDDVLSLVAFDDFDPFVNVTGQCPTTVEEMAVGYIPDLETLALGWSEDNTRWLARAKGAMASPLQVFGPEAKRQPLLVFSRYKINGLGSLGMGSLHQVALMRALVRCIGKTLCVMEGALDASHVQRPLMNAFEIGSDDLKSLRFMMVDLLGQEELGIVFFVSNWSVAAALNTRIQSLTFEEVVNADRTGCLEREFKASEWFCELCKFYVDIDGNDKPEFQPADALEKPRPLSAGDIYDKIQQTHPLRWVRSTPAVRKDVFYPQADNQPVAEIRGWIDATTHLRLAPGHQYRAQQATNEVACRRSTSETSPGGADTGRNAAVFKSIDDLVTNENFTIHQLGASDLALPHSDWQPSDRNRLVPVRDFLQRVYDLMAVVGGGVLRKQSAEEDTKDTSGERRIHGRDIVGATTFCGVPVPVLRGDDQEPLLSPKFDSNKHIAMLEVVLPVLKRRLLLNETPSSPGDEQDAELKRDLEDWQERLTKAYLPQNHVRGEYWGALSPSNICEQARLFGLPQTLIRTLEFVYHSFTTLLANPMAFDSVLDLYDVFASFHRVITEHLPAACEDMPVDKRRVDMIAGLIDAVHRSLGHRMYRLFPENSHRDMDIDFRGGLNALVYSADGVLKMGVGVLRHHLLKDAVNDRARVGVVTRIGFRQGISAITLRLGVESRSRLGIVETDVPHLYHIPSYVDFLHEAFHLVYEAARNPGEPGPKDNAEPIIPMLPTVPRDSGDLYIDGRLAEVFANLLTALFVCPEEPQLLAEHMIVQYATSPNGMREYDSECVGNLIELACHLYIVCRAVDYLRSPARNDGTTPWWFCDNDGEEELIARFLPEMSQAGFVEFFLKLLPFFSSTLPKNPKVVEALKYQAGIIFDEVYDQRLSPFVPIVVAKVCLVYSRYWFRAAGRLINSRDYKDCIWLRHSDKEEENKGVSKTELESVYSAWKVTREELKGEIRKFGEGNFTPFSFLAWQPKDGKPASLDPMIVLSVVLENILEDRSKELHGADSSGPYHLPTKAGAACFDQDRFVPQADKAVRPKVFIQRGVSSLFSSDLDYRAQRLGSRITALKMFGDIASRLRSKRLAEMLRRNLSTPAKN